VDDRNAEEHPSHLNMEGQNAQHTSAAGEALSGGSSRSDSGQGEKAGRSRGGKPVMEKYAYHSMSLSCHSLLLFKQMRWRGFRYRW